LQKSSPARLKNPPRSYVCVPSVLFSGTASRIREHQRAIQQRTSERFTNAQRFTLPGRTSEQTNAQRFTLPGGLLIVQSQQRTKELAYRN
jgi:hypothetical protein